MSGRLAPVRGRVDGQGRLVEADPELLTLHLRAGGQEGGVLAPPQLAALVRLVRRIGIVVSRGVLVADEEGDLDLWVRAQPDDGGVSLAIAGWNRRAAVPASADLPAREQDFTRADADWTFATDAALRIVSLVPPHSGVSTGDPLTRLFTLQPGEQGALPMLEAVAMQRRFADQHATVAVSGEQVRLAGAPLIDGLGRLAGFSGAATIVPAEAAGGPGAVNADAFGERLDAALRGPLDRIVANAETIRAQSEGPLRRDYSAYATDIATAGRHLLALVGDLVDLQAIERPDFTVAPEPIDLADVARRAAGLLGVRAADRGVRIDRPAEDEAAPVHGDFRRVLQILVNLIGNAVRYSPEGGMLWVRCEPGGRTASVVVADQGKGLAAEDQSRIFEKFERVDPSEPGGTGLGLYISRRLARAMGGDITVDSAPGQGARFVLTLPAR
ncbi:sensor histidine kinase [Sphingomonas profundi]|uniref:sensor histidine kinase n=1 Tax=Alterirhizorhabdus profundi TaxID=2681549 RepID=UPI0012E84E51|nr:HAMP domain-containing sensor histidine kinase [Sphingomonas profundi]